MYDAAMMALTQLTNWQTMLALVAGVVTGLVVVILPGLGGTAGLALLLSPVFGFEPSSALAMMIGLLAFTTSSDTFPSVLMGNPGTSGSQATVLDGFPMTKNGEGTLALSITFVSSLFGGIFGAFVLSFAVIFAIPIILQIGFGEQLMLVLLALSMVGILTGANLWKGLAAWRLGLLLGALSSAPLSGVRRTSIRSAGPNDRDCQMLNRRWYRLHDGGLERAGVRFATQACHASGWRGRGPNPRK